MSTYADKLKDPRWQRLRLEKLEASSWCCDACGADNKTLHVHHHQYFKGREPWEYDQGQLGVLCVDCHKQEHATEDPLLLVASFIGTSSPFDRVTVASMVAGFSMMPAPAFVDEDVYALGELISFMPKPWSPGCNALSKSEISLLIHAICKDHEGFSECLRGFIEATGVAS